MRSSRQPVMGAAGAVTSFLDGDNGTYYATNSASGSGASLATVKSNTACRGNVKADENSATGASADLTIAGGALR